LHKSGQDLLMQEKLNMRSKYIIFQLFKNNIITSVAGYEDGDKSFFDENRNRYLVLLSLYILSDSIYHLMDCLQILQMKY
jgi:hypothetical protein